MVGYLEQYIVGMKKVRANPVMKHDLSMAQLDSDAYSEKCPQWQQDVKIITWNNITTYPSIFNAEDLRLCAWTCVLLRAFTRRMKWKYSSLSSRPCYTIAIAVFVALVGTTTTSIKSRPK
jgi:hypothetical protein